ncbi:MAG: transcription repressor NadR [Erysipelotrichaceae bacterium]|nr:transcription repressor NadR [Erysipelotrichaceae bacterium]
MDRKEEIIKVISKSEKPISASRLASQFGVSRQIIVGDIALLRAKGYKITATPRGYILDNMQLKNTYTIAVKHTSEQMGDEMYTIVDLGGYIIDVIVEHPVYGQLIGDLHISSRYDVDQFLEKVKKNDASPLSKLTHGIHLHTLQCSSDEIYHRIEKALDEKGYLLK